MIALTSKSRQPKRKPWPLDRLIYERSIALGHCLDRSTVKNYSSALNSYITFCKNHERPVEPTPDTLSFYVVYMSRFVKPDSVETYLSGICSQLEPHFPNIRVIRTHYLVTRTLKGCKRLFGTPIRRKLPLTIANLQTVIDALHSSTSHDDRLFLCALLTGFHALMRCGELTIPDDPSRRDSQKVTKRSSISWPSASSYGFVLPATKTDIYFESSHLVVRRFIPSLDPLPFFKDYLASRDNLFPLNPELWLNSKGTVPTRSWFLARLRRFFPDTRVAGQSMRAGGATCLASTGASPSIIQAAGRWSSNTFQIYIRKNPILLNALIHSDVT